MVVKVFGWILEETGRYSYVRYTCIVRFRSVLTNGSDTCEDGCSNPHALEASKVCCLESMRSSSNDLWGHSWDLNQCCLIVASECSDELR